MTRILLVFAAFIALLVLFGWATDAVTLQGERTVYTVRCERGQWEGERCTGELVAAERYRFRALRTQNEVLFWVVGSKDPSRILTQCSVLDGRNWTCQPGETSSYSIALQMSRGDPVPGSEGRADTQPFHAVSKLRWLLLRYHVPFGDALSGT